MPSVRGFFGAIIAAAGVAAPVHCAALAPTVAARELFLGASASARTTPVEVEVTNPGPDTRGFLTTIDAYGSWGDRPIVRYPIELPRGASKRVILYGVYGYGTRVVLETGRGTVATPLPGQMSGNVVRQLVHIGDDAGGFAFLRGEEGVRGSHHVVYCGPEKAPPRMAGYADTAAVLLGGGSERMSDAAVGALREYVLTGGTLVFLGGSAPLVWQDPRWRAMLPVVRPRVEVVRGWGRLGIATADPVNGPVTIATGDPAPSASVRKLSGHALYAVRAHGRGRVIAFGPDLLSAPLEAWNARRALFNEAVRPGAFRWRTFFSRPLSMDLPGGTGPYPGGLSAPPPGYPLETPDDPFQVQLPSFAFAGWTLAGFFIAVVPVNFLVLRRLRKTEWAWFTSPLIAAAFAGVFLFQARSLYALGLTTGLTGEVIEHAGQPGAVFVGEAKMFFPSAGQYDLGLKDVDSVGLTGIDSQYDDYGRPGRGATIQSLVDDGSIRAPAVRTGNLAFQAINFVQRFPGAQFLSTRTEWTRDGGLVVTVTNVGRFPLKSVALHTSDQHVQSYAGSDLDPGQSLTLPAVAARSVIVESREWGVRSKQGPVLFVTAVIEGLRPGPQVGKLLPQASRVTLVSALDVPEFGGRR